MLRTALSLSLCLNKPFQIVNIRAKRKKPGLRPQHLAAILAAAEISQATITGAKISSPQLTFTPRRLSSGRYHFGMATAGSTTMVMQTILPALLTTSGSSNITLEGGTHNPMAPPFDFFLRAFLPVMHRMGAGITARLLKPGFYPAGGGKIQVDIEPVLKLHPVELVDRGSVKNTKAMAVVSRLPEHIAWRELAVVRQEMGLMESCLETRTETRAKGPGNVIMVTVESENITEVFTGFGIRGVRAETVAAGVVQEVRRYLEAEEAVVGKYLADQLLLPLALARGGSFTTLKPSPHTLTQIKLIRAFAGHEFSCQPLVKDVYLIKFVR